MIATGQIRCLARIFCLSLGTLWAASAAAEVQVTVLTDPGDSWSKETLAVVQKAAEVVFSRIASYDVAQCAYRNTFREDKDKLRAKWGRQITVLNKNPKVSIMILKKKLEPRILGEAQLNRADIDHTFFQINHLEITLNEVNLNKYAAKYRTDSGDQEQAVWINTIAHEIAHNFGYKHGVSGNWLQDYPGYFPTELGFCVLSEGRYGSDLDDPELRREYQALSKQR